MTAVSGEPDGLLESARVPWADEPGAFGGSAAMARERTSSKLPLDIASGKGVVDLEP